MSKSTEWPFKWVISCADHPGLFNGYGADSTSDIDKASEIYEFASIHSKWEPLLQYRQVNPDYGYRISS